MFETVATERFQDRGRRLFYETLPVSLAVHAAAVAAVIVGTVWTVTFPDESPRVTVPYSLTRVPDPPPPPPPPPKAAVKQPEPVKQLPPPPPVKLAQIVAPTIIPDKIPDVIEPPPIPELPLPVATATAPPVGDPNGSSDGILGGDIAGKIHGKAGGLPWPDDGRVHIARDEKLPLESVEQEYPHYPDDMRKKRVEDQVVVRYVIGTNGRVTDVEIVSHASDKSFDDAAVEAIRKWRFRPMVKDGKKVEVMHELAVNFEIVVR
jgi:protein TonB